MPLATNVRTTVFGDLARAVAADVERACAEHPDRDAARVALRDFTAVAGLLIGCRERVRSVGAALDRELAAAALRCDCLGQDDRAAVFAGPLAPDSWFVVALETASVAILGRLASAEVAA